jgi:hypothetical protein
VPKEGRLSQSSTFFGFASALVGSKPGVGQSFESDALIGLRALAFIQRDENERPRIQSLGVLREAPPVAAQPEPAVAPVTTAPVTAAPVAQPTPAPVATAAAPAATLPPAMVGAGAPDDLPWK